MWYEMNNGIFVKLRHVHQQNELEVIPQDELVHYENLSPNMVHVVRDTFKLCHELNNIIQEQNKNDDKNVYAEELKII